MITMTRRFDRDSLRFFARVARAWGLAGAALVLTVPAARGHHAWIGWLPFWLLVAPALILLQLDALMGFERARRWRRRWDIARRRTRVQARRRAPRERAGRSLSFG